MMDVRTYRPLPSVDDEASVPPGLYTTELIECYEVVAETRGRP